MVQVLTHFQVIIILHDGPTTVLNSEIIICIAKIFSLSFVVHSPQTDLLIFGVLAAQVSRQCRLVAQASCTKEPQKLAAEFSLTS
jgi:hypothetical protein